MCTLAKVLIYRAGTQQAQEVDFRGVDGVPVMVLQLDQGPSCVAMCAWMQENGVLCLPVWDKIHRCQRDLKGSGPEFLQFAQLATMYLWSANYKPFNSQGFFQDKLELLQSFLSIESKARSVVQFLFFKE